MKDMMCGKPEVDVRAHNPKDSGSIPLHTMILHGRPYMILHGNPDIPENAEWLRISWIQYLYSKTVDKIW